MARMSSLRPLLSRSLWGSPDNNVRHGACAARRGGQTKLIIAGGSAIRVWILPDSGRSQIRSRLFLRGYGHFAGLVAGGVHPSPFPHAMCDVDNHKTCAARAAAWFLPMRGVAKKINSAVFPPSGRPLDDVIAAKAVALVKRSSPIQDLCKQVADNAKALAATLIERGYGITTGGTDNHLCGGFAAKQPPERRRKRASGAPGSPATEWRAVRYRKPMVTSGFGSGRRATSRGFGIANSKRLAS